MEKILWAVELLPNRGVHGMTLANWEKEFVPAGDLRRVVLLFPAHQ
jgi:hypothetical protein